MQNDVDHKEKAIPELDTRVARDNVERRLDARCVACFGNRILGEFDSHTSDHLVMKKF